MADIKFSCPQCNQHISCDEAWSGRQIQCPACQGELIVPTKPAPAPARVAAAELPPARTIPAQEAPKLVISLAQPQQPAAAAPAPVRSIPIRNLAPPPPPKPNVILKALKITAVVIVLAVGGYFLFGWAGRMQEKANAKLRESDKNTDGGQLGHIADLYNVLDATETGNLRDLRGGGHATGPKQRQSSGPTVIPLPGAQEGMPSTQSPEQLLPLVPAVWSLDLQAATIPEGRVNGSISGANFVAEAIRVDPVGSAQVLRLIQGQPASLDREVLIYLHLGAGEKLGGQRLNISADMKGPDVPQVAKRWKANPRYEPVIKVFNSGYVLRLELGPMGDEGMSGKIFLALPDAERSVAAGVFSVAPGIVESATLRRR